MANVSLSIDIVADVVCPWCWVGKRRLEQAMAMLPEIDFTRRYRPFQLDPTIPRQGLERTSYINGKLGGPERVAAAHAHLEKIGQDLGLDFRFGAIRVAPNTLDAHRLIRWAGEAGVQEDVTERLFRLYFSEGGDPGDPAILAGVAEAGGMNGAEVRAWLDTEAERDEVAAEIAEAGRVGITGVPCFIIEGKYAAMGAQEPEALAAAFREIAEEKRFGAKA